MQFFDIRFHKLILFEKFDIKFYPVSMLKQLVEGRCFAYHVKGSDIRKYTYHDTTIYYCKMRLDVHIICIIFYKKTI